VDVDVEAMAASADGVVVPSVEVVVACLRRECWQVCICLYCPNFKAIYSDVNLKLKWSLYGKYGKS